MNESVDSLPAIQPLTVEAFRLLGEAVTSLMIDHDRAPTASEVRLEMKRRTYGGFNPEAIGFKRFRDFLKAAAAEGHVQLDEYRPGDIAVFLKPQEAKRDSAHYVRSDLWRAFVDWNPQMLRFYDKEAGRAVLLPKEKTPFEPFRFQEIRQRIADNAASFIEIQPISMRTQREWMRDHASSISDDELRDLLFAALDGEKPLKLFIDVLRAESCLDEWHHVLGKKVRDVVEEWRSHLPDDVHVDIERARTSAASTPLVQSAESHKTGRRVDDRQQALQRLLTSRSSAQDRPLSQDSSERDDDRELRSRLRAAIDRMPTSELRMLRIPVGYLFED